MLKFIMVSLKLGLGEMLRFSSWPLSIKQPTNAAIFVEVCECVV